MNIDFNQSELKQNHPSIPCCFCLTPSWPSVHPVFCIHVQTAYIYIHVLLYLCGLVCTSICSSIHTYIYLSMHPFSLLRECFIHHSSASFTRPLPSTHLSWLCVRETERVSYSSYWDRCEWWKRHSRLHP